MHVPMRWSDMDAYQHINNVAFLGYFEMARVNLFFEHPTHDEKTGMRRGLVVHSHEITYKRPVEYDADPLEIQIWVSGMRAASFPCHYELFDHGHSPSPAARSSCRSTSRSTARAGSRRRRRRSWPASATSRPPETAGPGQRGGVLSPRSAAPGGRPPSGAPRDGSSSREDPHRSPSAIGPRRTPRR